MKKLSIIGGLTLISYFVMTFMANITSPAPLDENGGFEVGAKYERTEIVADPFKGLGTVDTLTVTNIKQGIVYFGYYSVKIGSIEMASFKWRKL